MEQIKEQILQGIRQRALKPLKLKELHALVGISELDFEQFSEEVSELVESGHIIKTRTGRYGLPDRMNLVVGTLTCHPDGYGFIVPQQPQGRAPLPDIYVNARGMSGAMHGDRVIARVHGHMGRERLKASIIRILERSQTTIVGSYEPGKNFGHVIADDPRITQDLYIAKSDTIGAEAGQKVVAEIIEYPTEHHGPEGRISKILGHSGEPGVDSEVIIHKYGLKGEFRREILSEAERLSSTISESDAAGRADLRGLPTVTIDGADARDFDDAVSIEMRDGRMVLAVHIADVSHYVREATRLDEEAFSRATSVYLEDRVVPMLPERLSNDICSLRPRQDRLAMSVRLEYGPDGDLLSYDIFDSIINADYRLTYDEVYRMLVEDDQQLLNRYSDVVPYLRQMAELEEVLKTRRMNRGSLDLNFPEAKVELDRKGAIRDVVIRPRNVAHRIIEEFMLAANETIARHLERAGVAAIYRVHEEPEQEKASIFLDLITSLGYSLKSFDSRSLQTLVERAQGKPEEKLINQLLLRSLQEARYSAVNKGHFGLAFACYTHFTSPIRRYPDLVVHRLIRFLRTHGVRSTIDQFGDVLPPVADHCSIRESNAEDAERESLKIKQLQFMKDKLGEEFDAIVTGVQSFGLFVETTEHLVEGLVHISTIPDDYYHLREERHALHGEFTDKTYSLGDKVRVKVARVDLDRQQLDFVLVEDGASGSATVRKKARKPVSPSRGRRKAGRKSGRSPR